MKLRRSVLTALTLDMLAATASGQRTSTPQVPQTFPGVTSVLWIGAHPDDEVLAAPLLGRLCVEERLRCSFLVLTRGENGVCRLPGGCRPDMAAVRSAEMARAAQLFHASLTQWSYPDGGAAADGSPGTWDAVAGSHEALVDALTRAIRRSHADLVLTFDQRHGSTCHRDHRAVGRLVLEALPALSRRPAVYLLEGLMELGGSPLTLRFRPAASAAAGVINFDGNTQLPATGRAAWDLMSRDVLIHASQFEADVRRAVASVPPGQRAIAIGPADLLQAAAGVAGCE